MAAANKKSLEFIDFNKHKWAIQGKINEDNRGKRKKSINTNRDNKKGRSDLSSRHSISLETLDSNSTVSTISYEKIPSVTASDITSISDLDPLKTATSEVMDEEKFAQLFAAAMKTQDFVKTMTNIVKDAVTSTTDELNTRIDEIDFLGEIRDEKITTLESKVDTLEQKERAQNIIMTGINTQETSARKVSKTLNKLLDTHIAAEDILYAAELKTNDTTRLKIVFKDVKFKQQVWAQKRKLKNKEIWIAEDLTPARANLFFIGRQAVKKGHAHQCWTNEGKIFIKKAENTRPKWVRTPQELSEHIGAVPLLGK